MKTKFIEGQGEANQVSTMEEMKGTEGEVLLNRKSKVNTKAIKTDKTVDESYSLN